MLTRLTTDGTTVNGTNGHSAEAILSENQLRLMIDTIPALAWCCFDDGTAEFLNKRWFEYTGLSQQEAVGSGWQRPVHPDDLERLMNTWRAIPASGEPGEAGARVPEQTYEFETRIRGKDGLYRWFLVRFFPLRDREGDILRWYSTGTEIQDRKQAEERARNENLALREEIDKVSMFEEIVGASTGLQTVLSQVCKVAPTESTVLITGETGTGKELVARAIHKRSARSAQAFVSVNCAAIPQALIASELFGHEKGAFTGALQRRLGRFEMAEGGTIFLDEVGELPNETQIALLRVLQEREFERVGGDRLIRADVRVIAATNRDLKAAIASGAFRSDLFYRLSVFPIEMPPLRERNDDIPILVEYFIDRYATAAGRTIKNISKKSMELLQSYRWPGNVRELQNVIERSVILCETETFSVDESWITSDRPQAPSASQPLVQALTAQERAMIEAALVETRGRVSGPSGAAAKLGLRPSTLESKIRALKINKHQFRNVHGSA